MPNDPKRQDSVWLASAVELEPLWRTAIFQKKIVTLLPNTTTVHEALGIKPEWLSNVEAAVMTKQYVVWMDELEVVGTYG